MKIYAVSVDEERRTIVTFFVKANNPEEAIEKAKNNECEDSDYLHDEDYFYDWESVGVEEKERERESFPSHCKHCQSQSFELTGIIRNSETGKEEHIFTCSDCYKKTTITAKEPVFFTPSGFCDCGNKIIGYENLDLEDLGICRECR